MDQDIRWKTLKDYLESEGFIVNSPRSSIQIAFQSGLISDGHLWIDALEKRNLMAHTYDEERAQEANDLIRNYYYHMLVDLHSTLKRLGNLA
jgi:nucleotidyltransferase substrate binding protein (TIGR01987 family)